MIKASELRIGNHIMSDREYFDEPVFGVVYQVSEAGICFNYNEKGEQRGISNPLKNILPIPLTEEWLLKFGFVASNQNESTALWDYVDLKTGWFGLIEKDGYYKFASPSTSFGTQFHHVHQLQNLYFSLTGKELVASI